MNRSLSLLLLSLFALSCAPVETDPDKDRVAELFKKTAAGEYSSTCYPYTDNGKERSIIRQLELQTSEATLKETVWSNLHCAGAAMDTAAYAMTYKVIEKPKTEKDAKVELKNKIREEFGIYRQHIRMVIKNDALIATILKMSTIVNDKEEWLNEADYAAFKSSSYTNK